MTAVVEVADFGFNDGGEALDGFDLYRLDAAIEAAFFVEVFGFARQEGVFIDPDGVFAELDGVRIFGDVADDVLCIGFVDQLMRILFQRAARDVFVDKVGADEAGAFVAGGDGFDEVEVGQKQPAVVVAVGAGVFPDHEDLLMHIGGGFKVDIELLVAVAGVLAQNAELAGARSAAGFGDDHFYVG